MLNNRAVFDQNTTISTTLTSADRVVQWRSLMHLNPDKRGFESMSEPSFSFSFFRTRLLTVSVFFQNLESRQTVLVSLEISLTDYKSGV